MAFQETLGKCARIDSNPVDNLAETTGSHIALDKGYFDQSRLQQPSEVTWRVIGVNR